MYSSPYVFTHGFAKIDPGDICKSFIINYARVAELADAPDL